MSPVAAEHPIFRTGDAAQAAWHARSEAETLSALRADKDHGLDAAGVAERRTWYGPNELAETPAVPLWKKFLAQFHEVVIWILIVAAIVSGLLGEWIDAVAIVAIVLLNGALGFLQEQKAERALAALRQMSAPQAKVIRDGKLQVIATKDLVPGDRVELEAGDHIPADVRLLEAHSFRVQEAALTGESAADDKDAQAILDEKTSLGDRVNMAYLGTVAAAGKASAVVIATGMNTQLGHIAGMLERAAPEPTPLQKRLAALGRVLAGLCLGIVAVVFVLELLQGGDLFEVFLLSVSLAVAAVPEGLPAVVTVALALGLQRLIRRHALIRRLPSVETLGSVTVICTDKTGTLTRNEMTVRRISAGGRHFEVTGAGYAPRGEFRVLDGETIEPRSAPDLLQALAIAAHCNNARLAPQEAGDEPSVIGDPTEGALLVAALKAGVHLRDAQRLHEIPFSSERKTMSVVVRAPDGQTWLYSKGAPEVILKRCTRELRGGQVEPLSAERRQEIARTEADMAAAALRVLTLAYRECRDPKSDVEESNLIFAGLVGMIDPPREEVKQAVHTCHVAGIRPIMITGDHPATAIAIARELGIAGQDDAVIAGQELETLSDEELAAKVESISVYARVAPEHKLRIVRAWKSKGQIVAMTGDGVNDAPAIKAADIGIAMGRTGADVTKEASAMVLTDDNFTSIVSAVEEGRGIYDNIQKVLHYLLSCNAGEILLILAASLLGWPVPLFALQILWINLVTDGLPALGLALEPPEPGIMQRPPRPPQEPILSWRSGWVILLQGALVGAASLTAFGMHYWQNPEDIASARTSAFCVLVFSQLFLSVAARSQSLSLFRLGFLTNPYLLAATVASALLQLAIVTLPFTQPIFAVVVLSAGEWLRIVLLSLVPFVLTEGMKWMPHRLAAPAATVQGS